MRGRRGICGRGHSRGLGRIPGNLLFDLCVCDRLYYSEGVA